MHRLHQPHVAFAPALQLLMVTVVVLLRHVLSCRVNAGNTTSPASDNTFQIVIPPGLTPVGPITTVPGSPQGEVQATLGMRAGLGA
jgi:hypothetical protein